MPTRQIWNTCNKCKGRYRGQRYRSCYACRYYPERTPGTCVACGAKCSLVYPHCPPCNQIYGFKGQDARLTERLKTGF